MGAQKKVRSSPYGTTIPVTSGTRDRLAALKLSDGEESWEHLLRRATVALEYIHGHPEVISAEVPD